MPQFHYGQTTFEWQYQVDSKLRRHYVTVERGRPVLLRGPVVDASEQEALIQRRARWIREKLAEVNRTQEALHFVTGSRLRYRGKSYYCEVHTTRGLEVPELQFKYSRFIINSAEGNFIQPSSLAPMLERFFVDKAVEKLLPRVRHWERQTGLTAKKVSLHSFKTRWASCSKENAIAFHPRCMELSVSVLDYVIVHELCHTIEKNHTKSFWGLVSKHFPGWRPCHASLELAAGELSI